MWLFLILYPYSMVTLGMALRLQATYCADVFALSWWCFGGAGLCSMILMRVLFWRYIFIFHVIYFRGLSSLYRRVILTNKNYYNPLMMSWTRRNKSRLNKTIITWTGISRYYNVNKKIILHIPCQIFSKINVLTILRCKL